MEGKNDYLLLLPEEIRFKTRYSNYLHNRGETSLLTLPPLEASDPFVSDVFGCVHATGDQQRVGFRWGQQQFWPMGIAGDHISSQVIEEGKAIWIVYYNGRSGDDWSYSNFGNWIAWRCPWNAETARKIREAEAKKQD